MTNWVLIQEMQDRFPDRTVRAASADIGGTVTVFFTDDTSTSTPLNA